jgi:tRNA A-37 threonylcarbamoyl transferase component Bud32
MTNYIKALETSKPVAFGGFSELHIIDGKAVKVLEDGCYSDVLQECLLQKQAADAGLAPQVHNVFRKGDDVVVVMDAIDTKNFKHSEADNDDIAPTLLGELNDDEMLKGFKLYCKMLQAGIVHADYHTGNFFFGPNGKSLAIDFGIASQLGIATKTHLTRAVQFLLPCLQRLDLGYLADDLIASYQSGSKNAIRESLEFIAAEVA